MGIRIAMGVVLECHIIDNLGADFKRAVGGGISGVDLYVGIEEKL